MPKSQAETLFDSIIGEDLLKEIDGSGGDNDQTPEPEDTDDGEDADTGPVTEDAQDDEQDASEQDGEADADEGNEADEQDDDEEDEQLSDRPEPKKSRKSDDDQAAARNNNSKQRLFDPRARFQTDKAGNVYSNGKLIAKAGREARLFHTFHAQAREEQAVAARMAGRAVDIANGARELLARFDQLSKQKSALDVVGLSAEEQMQLLPIIKRYKENPIEGLKMMLTQAHLSGVDIKSLGAAGALDPKLMMDQMTKQVRELLSPMLQETSVRQQQDARRAEAVGFFKRNPRAREVAKVVGGSARLGQILKAAMDQAPDLSIDELFQKLDYALLQQFGGRLPATGPVTKPPKGKPPVAGKSARRQEKTFERSAPRTQQNRNQSIDDIGRSILAEIAAAENRGN